MPLDPQAKTYLAPYDSMIHGFFNRSAVLDRAKDAIEQATAALRAAFAKGLGQDV